MHHIQVLAAVRALQTGLQAGLHASRCGSAQLPQQLMGVRVGRWLADCPACHTTPYQRGLSRLESRSRGGKLSRRPRSSNPPLRGGLSSWPAAPLGEIGRAHV